MQVKKMKTLLKLVKNFEKRNNISIAITICSDGSGSVEEFWSEEVLKEYKDIEELTNFIKDTQYVLDSNGRCIYPTQIV